MPIYHMHAYNIIIIIIIINNFSVVLNKNNIL